MKVNLISNIYFQANQLSFKPQVVKRDETTGEYKTEKASMVEIDLKNPNDIKVMKELGEKWDNDYLMENMADNAENIANREDQADNHRFFAVTSQKDNFENLNSDKVLSFCEVHDETYNKAKVEYIQSNAESTTMYNPKYKRCGSAMLDGLKHYYNYIYLYSLPCTIQFYLNNEFKQVKSQKEYNMEWKNSSNLQEDIKNSRK